MNLPNPEKHLFHKVASRTTGALLTMTGLILLLAGCAAPQLDLSLKNPLPPQFTGPAPPLPVVLGVDDFVDLRPQTRGSDNQKWKGLIPGILWIDIGSDMPEIYTAFSPFNTRPLTLSMADAMADTLTQAGMCRGVVFMPVEPYTQVEYRLEGVMRRSFVGVRGYYYGSTIYAWLLRVLGLPFVSFDVAFEVDLRLRSMATNTIVWEGKITGNRQDKYNNIYRLSRGRDGKHLVAYNFSRIIAEQLPALLPDLRKALERERDAHAGGV